MLKKTTLAAVLTGLSVAIIMPAPADAMRRGSNAVPEQRAKLKAEFAQAKRAGGYGNPITAIGRWLRGEGIGTEIQPVVDVPRSGIVLKSKN
ncbi:MAG: DUF4148 domain-containing protein [Pseudomonadota bacterium]